MSGLVAVFSVVFPTGVLDFLLTMLTCVDEVTVVFAQIGDDSVIEKATTQAPEKAIEKTKEATMQKVVAKAAQEGTAKEELKARRPEALNGPTTVHFMVFVVDINDIDDTAQNFTANVYLRLR